MIDENTKKKKRNKGAQSANNLSEKPTKDELMIAKYLRSKLPVKEGKLALMVVNIFDGNEAVNALLASKWATGSNKYQLLFPNRHYAVEYLRVMMIKNLFHRAIKMKKKSKKKLEDKQVSCKKKLINGQTEENKSPKTSSKKKSAVSKEGKKARMKLEFHEFQTFNPDDPDGDDVYVWIYEPFNPAKCLLGGLVLLVILGFCLFPIWPAQLRSVTYYGSIGLMGILALLIGLVVLRAILFCLVWTLTLGRHHFWMLPNLTEDCGVLESFRPLYQHEYSGSQKGKFAKKSSKKKSKVAEEDAALLEPSQSASPEEEASQLQQQQQESGECHKQGDDDDYEDEGVDSSPSGDNNDPESIITTTITQSKEEKKVQ